MKVMQASTATCFADDADTEGAVSPLLLHERFGDDAPGNPIKIIKINIFRSIILSLLHKTYFNL